MDMPQLKTGFFTLQGCITESVPEQYVTHLADCVSTESDGFSKKLFNSYPWADCYTGRSHPSRPGHIDIRGNGKDQRLVINMFGQYEALMNTSLTGYDDLAHRKEWFDQCLQKIYNLKNLTSLAFQECGCGKQKDPQFIYKTIKMYAHNYPHVRTVLYAINFANKLKI